MLAATDDMWDETLWYTVWANLKWMFPDVLLDDSERAHHHYVAVNSDDIQRHC